MTMLSKRSLFTRIHENSYYSCQASNWRCRSVKKHCSSIDWTRNTHAHDVTVSTNSRFSSLHAGDNGIIFKNVHFETHFQKFAFSGPPLSWKWTAKSHTKFPVFSHWDTRKITHCPSFFSLFLHHSVDDLQISCYRIMCSIYSLGTVKTPHVEK